MSDPTSGPTSGPTIELAEATELLAALVDRVGRSTGCRVLLIKGAATQAHRLRAPRASADVDVLVPRSEWSRFVAAMLDAGWRRTLDPDRPAAFENHSATLTHELWPCELDVHRFYPGFLRDADEVFDRLWAERTTLPLASRPVAATGVLGSTLIAALHALREPEVARNQSELAQLVDAVHETGIDTTALGELAAHTGAGASLGLLWERLGIAVPTSEDDPDALREWTFRTEAGHRRSIDWVVTLRRAPLWRWPLLLFRALWPTDDDIRVRAHTTDRGWALLRHRRQRLRDGLRGLPAALRLAWKYRR